MLIGPIVCTVSLIKEVIMKKYLLLALLITVFDVSAVKIRKLTDEQAELLAYKLLKKAGIVFRADTVVKQYHCNVPGCDKFYPYRNSLRQHVKAMHEEVRYPCDYPGCSHQATQKSNLSAHKMAKHGMVRYVCNVFGCDKSYLNKYRLNDHKRKHHS